MKYIVANWKMHHTIDSAHQFLTVAREALRLAKSVEVIICPSFPLLPSVRNELVGTPIKVGAQNLSTEEQGALTGEVSGVQLESLVDYVIVGHSERRRYFKETNHELAKKLERAWQHQITPILCFEKVEDLHILRPLKGKVVLAYEPISAIGTGHPDTPGNAASIAKMAQQYLSQDLPVLYGGSVTPDNVKSFLQFREISGALVGGASLEAATFVNLVHASA
jgi:triosephosphate isomerase (TIM)